MKQISLQGEWQLQGEIVSDGSASAAECSSYFKEHQSLSMNIPGDVHSTLLEHHLIPDPYFATNELDIQWIGRSGWTLKKTVTLSDSFFSSAAAASGTKDSRQFITLESADTFVHVIVNGSEAGFCYNYFRRWRFDVTGLLHTGSNTLQLKFDSAERCAITEADKLPYSVPCSVFKVGSPHRNLVRKIQCHSGWDWGPCIMAFGIYDDIRLESTAIGFIDYVTTETFPCLKKHGPYVPADCTDTEWTVKITTTVRALTGCTRELTFVLCDEEKAASESVIAQGTKKCTLSKGENSIVFELKVQKPELWYCSGGRPQDDEILLRTGASVHTENKLYKLTVTLAENAENSGESFLKVNTSRDGKQKNLPSAVIHIAFRTLETITEADSDGKSLYFKVNGRAIFAKGSDWIPADALPSRITPEKADYLLTSLVRSNQNMIRVWGGGQYETDYFYDLCDRKGILVWQDCMFACSMYPSTSDFLANVQAEIAHQVRRLQHHACIALWCGNNEDLGALNWYEETRKNRDRYLVDYDRLNEGCIGATVRRFDSSRIFWPSSPCAGENDYSDNWHDDSKGDMHFWSVWHEKKPFEAYLSIKPRFVSEFGYQSFSSIEEVESYASPTQLNLTSPVMEFHQRSPGGNSIILENFSRYFRFPEGFESMLYLSQVQQALAIKTAVEYWRSLRPLCMGTIYWQLNDVWPVASWSSIEYSGKWKLLHYVAQRFFAPLAILPVVKDGTITISVINETVKKVTADLTVAFISFSGEIIRKETLPVCLSPDSVTASFEESLKHIPAAADSCFLYTELACSNFSVHNSKFLAKPKECELQKARIDFSVDEPVKMSENTVQQFRIRLSTDRPAFFVALSTRFSGIFSDNDFTLLPGTPYEVKFTLGTQKNGQGNRAGICIEEFRKSLKIVNIRSTYR
jgi:beta-mannosidase